MSDRHKRQATRPTQPSQDESGPDVEMLDDTTVVGSMRLLSRTRRPSQKAPDNEETQSTAGLTGVVEILSQMEEQMRGPQDTTKKPLNGLKVKTES